MQAQTPSERVLAYQQALHTDPNIAFLKILDMTSPMSVTSVYVRLRLQREAKASLELDPVLSEAESVHDPNRLLQANQLYLENRFSAALEPDEAIRRFRHCIVLGDPGAGKTTLLKNLALRSVDRQLVGLPHLPIHIELNAFANSNHSNLIDFAAAQWEKRYGFPKSEARSTLIKHLKAGSALLLLDALDETVIGETASRAENSYRRVSEAIMTIAMRYHQSFIVVTARKAGYHQRPTLTGFTELVVLDFRPQDIRQFVNNWFACHQDTLKRSNTTELNSKLDRNPRIQALAANPLLLSLIVILYEAHLDLPDRRAELYKQCVDTLMIRWDASRNIRRRRQFKPEHKHLLLDEIAWHFHKQGRRYFPEKDLLEIIADFLPAIGLPANQNKDVLAEIANENGLIKEQAHGWHGFLHLTLQEYFVAQHVADRNQLGLLLAHWGEPWWEEVILLFAGHTPDASLLLKMLLGQDTQNPLQRDIFYSNLILAGRCLAARPVIRQPQLRENVINLLIDGLLKTPFSLMREQIADTLVEIGGREINNRLLSFLSDPQTIPDVSIAIAFAFSKLGDGSLSSDLLQLLRSPYLNLRVKQAIAYTLGTIRSSKLSYLLLQVLSDPQIALPVREKLALSLGEQEENTIVPYLIELLRRYDIAVSVREAIALVLGKLGDRSLASTLLKLVYDNQLDINIRCRVIEALGMLGNQSVVDSLLKLFIEAEQPTLQQSAALALSKIGDASVLAVMLKFLENPKSRKNVYLSAINVVVALGSTSDSLSLLSLICDEKLGIDERRALIDAVTILGDRSISLKLLHLVTNQQIPSFLRAYIIDALSKLGNRSVISELTRLLGKYTDLETKTYILCTLGKLHSQSTSAELIKAFQDIISHRILVTTDLAYERLLLHIVDTFSQTGDPSIVPYLLPLLSNRHFQRNTRVKFVNAIGQLADDEGCVNQLVKHLNGSDITDDVYRVLWAISRRLGIVVPYKDK